MWVRSASGAGPDAVPTRIVMAKEGGGGGAFGWTLLGFLAGVAATLGLQVLIGGDHHQSAPTVAQAPAPVQVVAASSAPVVKPAKKAAVASAAPATPAQPADAEV